MTCDKPQVCQSNLSRVQIEGSLGVTTKAFEEMRYPKVKKVATGHGQSQKQRVIITNVPPSKTR